MRVLPHALDYIKGGKKKQRCGYREHELIEVLESGTTVNLGKSGAAEYWLFWSAPDKKACIAIMLQNASAVVSVWESNYKYAENIRRATEDDIAMVQGLYEFKFSVSEKAAEKHPAASSDIMRLKAVDTPGTLENLVTATTPKPGFAAYLQLLIDGDHICEMYAGPAVSVNGRKNMKPLRLHQHFVTTIDALYEIGLTEPDFAIQNAQILLVEEAIDGKRDVIYTFPFNRLHQWRQEAYGEFTVTATINGALVVTESITLAHHIERTQIKTQLLTSANGILWSLIRDIEACIANEALAEVRVHISATHRYTGEAHTLGPWSIKRFEKDLAQQTKEARLDQVTYAERIWSRAAKKPGKSLPTASKETVRINMSGRYYSVWIDTHVVLSERRHTPRVLLRSLKGSIRQMLQDIEVLESTHNSDPFYFWNIEVIRHKSGINQTFQMHLRDLCNILFNIEDSDAEVSA